MKSSDRSLEHEVITSIAVSLRETLHHFRKTPKQRLFYVMDVESTLIRC